jgi:hypothetical protein
MFINLLLTEELEATLTSNIEITHCWDDNVTVVFPNKTLTGKHVTLHGEKEYFIQWLKPFDSIPIGVGVPQFQKFEIVHIKDNL